MSAGISAVGALALGSVAVGGYSAYKQGKASDKAANSADNSARLQYDISQQQIDLANEQWNLYRDKILPLEQESQKLGVDAQELAFQRGEDNYNVYKKFYEPLQESFATDAEKGIQPQYDRVQRDARTVVDQTFDSVEGQNRRELERRGVRPGSPGYGMGDTSLARGATQALSVRQAGEMERDRVERENFNRKAVALGRQPTNSNPIQAPGSPGVTASGANSLYGAAGAGAYRAGATSASLANTYGNNASGALQGGIQLGTQALDLYNRFAQPTGGAGGGSYGNYSLASGGGSGSGFFKTGGNAPGAFAFAEGGMVPELSRGDPGGGMVDGQPGRDMVPAYIERTDGGQEPAALTAGEIVIPREVVLEKGTDFFEKLLASGKQKKADRSRPMLGRMN